MKRNLWKILATLLVLAVLVGCAQPAPEVVEKEVIVEKPVVETVVVEKEKVVEKPVVETVVVEKEVVVKETVEVEKVSTRQSPMLQEMVKAGELPPLEERLPLEPRVVPAVEGIGKYSGRMNLVSFGTFGDMGHGMLHGLFSEYNDGTMFADCMKGYDVSDDRTTYTFYIRKGLKWSDGTPVTTADVKFWYEDDALNKEINPSTPGYGYTLAGEFCTLEIVDDYTYKLSWSKPNPTFPYTLRYWAGMYFTSWVGTPAHYMKQFHKKYNPDIEAEAQAEGFDDWVSYYGARKNPMSGDYAHLKPALGVWLVKEVAETHNHYVRNPYYWGVDEAGNQLPYFDEVVEQIVSDKETYTLKVAAGEADYAAFHTKIADMPLYVESADKGGYEVRQYRSTRGSDESFSFNLTDPDLVLREIFNDPRWGQAMSYAINREEIRDVVFLGTGVPRQAAPNEDSSFFKEEWANFCAEYDPDKANALLDEMGLDKRDANGYRLRPDGKTLSIRVDYTTNIDSPAEDVLVLVAQYWEDVGVKVEYKQLERDLLFERGQSNEVQVSVWHTDRTNESRVYVPAVGKIVGDSIQGEVPGTNEYYRWHSTNGEEGIEPPDDWKEHFEDIDAWHSATSKQEYDRLAKKIFDFCILKHLRVIGTVGFTTWPVIVKLDMGNIPPAGSFMGDDVGFIRGLRPETWYRK